MSINLNDESFNQKAGKAVFNGGNAGIVEAVTVSLVKKTKDDNANAPDYKVLFTDSVGASCNSSFWFIKEDTKYQTVDQQTAKQGKILKHIAHAVLGDKFEFPAFSNVEDMLNGVMKLIREGLPKAGQFRVFANYGTKEYSKKFIQPRSWVPFMESMSVAIESTRLKAGDLDSMMRLEEDASTGAPSGSKSTSTDDDDWD